MPDYAEARRNMVDNQLRPNQVDDPRVLEAMGTIPRELFVPKALRGVAYADDDLDLGGGRFLIEPLALGKLLQAAETDPTDVALVIGCGTGYTAAVLARLAATVFLLLPEGSATQPVDDLLGSLGCDNVIVRAGNLRDGLPEQAPFDVILLAGAVVEVPETLFGQLAEGGRLVAVQRHRLAGKVTVWKKIGGAVGCTMPFDAMIPELTALRPQPRFVF